MPTKELPAVLTMQFPAAADVWLSDKRVNAVANEEQVLKSPTLKPGENYTFDVRARWKAGDKVYETRRSVAVASGDRSRLLVLSGEEVK